MTNSSQKAKKAAQPLAKEQKNEVIGALQEQKPPRQRPAPTPLQHQPTSSSTGSRHPRSVSRGMDGSAYSHGGGRYDRYGESKYNEDLHDSRSMISYRGNRHQRRSSPDSMAYHRFLELESRAQQLEHAYNCIRLNRPVDGAVAATPDNQALAGSWEEKDEHPSDMLYQPPTMLKPTSAAANWLNSHPESSDFDDGTNASGGD